MPRQQTERDGKMLKKYLDANSTGPGFTPCMSDKNYALNENMIERILLLLIQ